MYRLHYYPANASAAPHMLLEEIGAPYELALVDRSVDAQKSADYLKLNPAGRIPAFEHDGLVLFEAAAIVLHLVDQHPAAGLAPPVGTAERAKFYQWLTFLTNSLQEELMIYQYPERLAGDDRAAIGIVQQGAAARAGAFLDIVENHLRTNGPYFLGAAYSAVDLYFAMLARWGRSIGRPPRSRPAVAALLDRVTARPAVQRAYASEGIPSPVC